MVTTRNSDEGGCAPNVRGRIDLTLAGTFNGSHFTLRGFYRHRRHSELDCFAHTESGRPGRRCGLRAGWRVGLLDEGEVALVFLGEVQPQDSCWRQLSAMARTADTTASAAASGVGRTTSRPARKRSVITSTGSS
jgi:hypothetical protein